ncbi:MAG: hypothetical protein E7513_07820 [Ruminococcaceae bacterium]|nr:hypothetical protein [Oscillospiraceae bacterium]
MRKNIFTSLFALIVCCALLMCSVICVSALDDKYTIDELGLSIKIPKEYTVITRTTEQGDEAFKTLGLDYDETMTAFSAANIHLQATSDDNVLKITLTKTADKNSEAINNYSELKSSERKTVLEAFLSDDAYTSGVEIKHNGNIYFDLGFSQQTQSGIIYGYQCHSVINGMNINLTLQKNAEELTADEIKVVTNIANSINFKKIVHKAGVSFDWWRVLLWIVILIVIGLLAKYFYDQYNKSKKEKKNERRNRLKKSHFDTDFETDKLLESENEPLQSESKRSLLSELGFEEEELSFDEMLGYDTIDYFERANTDMDSFDIEVNNKDRSSGVEFFEDQGKTINDRPDYFENYFTEKTEENRSPLKRVLSMVVLYAKVALRHLGYFFKNLSKMLTGNKENNRKNR